SASKTRDVRRSALATGEWKRADRLARKSKCWADATVRLRIRVQALAQVENYEECMQVGDGLEDKEIKRWVNICRRAQQ
ncbi:MAG: hypothetical protein HC927_04620, partial [Deltaproteobacteria bacterium]|nr:hypothetical protein [Deltaproteobacteria bacterium]